MEPQNEEVSTPKRKMTKPKTGFGAPPPPNTSRKKKYRGTLDRWLSMLKGRPNTWGWRQYKSATSASALKTHLNKTFPMFESVTRGNRLYVRFLKAVAAPTPKVTPQPVESAAPTPPMPSLYANTVSVQSSGSAPVIQVNKVRADTKPVTVRVKEALFLRKADDAQRLNALNDEVQRLRAENLSLKIRKNLGV